MSGKFKVKSKLACQFCNEIAGERSTQFHKIYGQQLTNRIVARHKNFLAVPTLGQLFPGSLLIVPEHHVENFSQLPLSLLEESLEFLKVLEVRMRQYGRVFVYEHGAVSVCGGGCGIYHAHLHLVPLPLPTLYQDLVKYDAQNADNLLLAWESVKDSTEYIVGKQGDAENAFYSVRGNGLGFGSQYIRRRMVEHFGLKQDWDWRKYTYAEPYLLETVKDLAANRG